MCGIAGVALAKNTPPPDPARLAAMQKALAHRGPDGEGQTILGQTALTHNRLAIIDIPGGAQPIRLGHNALVANGEIYNYRELRAAHPNEIHITNSDCEPPLHLFTENPATFAAQLRGMFAIAIYEGAGRTLTLTRDPFGIKPLYWTEIPGGIAFASEAQALLAAGAAPRTIRPQARDELLQMQFTSGAETIFANIHRVLPGETLTISNGKPVHRSRLPALPPGPPEPIGEADALARLDRALMESVDLHQRSDVPYGLFLSGGIDSAAILATMARLNDRPVLAFTAGFDVPGAADERALAATLAKSVGAEHETLNITKQMVWRHLPQIVACMDDPAADYAIIPTWFLAQRARQSVKVVLSGEGGDEIFGGYGRYRSAMRPWWQGGKNLRAKGTFDGLNILRKPPTHWRDGLAAAEAQATLPGRIRLQIVQATDIADWLPNDLLTKLDRCLMAHAVEGRTPFLDPAITRAGYTLPDNLKVRDRRGKYLLRRWLEGALPAAHPFAPKQGFTVPIGAWIAQDGARLGRLVAAQPGIAEICLPGRVEALFVNADGKREGMAAWIFLFYALWHHTHVLERSCEADVFEALSR